MPQITTNFSEHELNPHGFQISPFLRKNLVILAQQAEIIRVRLGNRRMHITSGYRTVPYELQNGRDGQSRHTLCEAIDFVVEGLLPHEVQAQLAGWLGGMGFGTTFTHIDIRHLSTMRPTPHRGVRWYYT